MSRSAASAATAGRAPAPAPGGRPGRARVGLVPGLVLGALLLASGCATVPAGSTPSAADPLERMNRGIFSFNEAVDGALLKPAAQFYQQVLPRPLRAGVDNFFGNLGDAWTSANLLLQAKPKAALDMGLRTAVNTVFGLGGVLDIAEEAGLDRFTSEDFGQTLGYWGLGSGPYLMLPLLGPSTLRDAGARVVDQRASLTDQIWAEPADRNGVRALDLLATRARLLGAGQVLDDIALDKYVLLRDAYLARRRGQLYDGTPPDETPGPPPFRVRGQ